MEVEAPPAKDWSARIAEAARHLEEHGWAVIERLYSEEECTQLHNQMWQLLEKASGGDLTRDLDYATVKAQRLPPHKHGILESYRINHAEFVRQVRRDLRIIRVFAALYGSDQLVSSLDRVNFKFPGRAYRSQGEWCHADQHPRQLDRLCVQSYLTVTAQREGGPGNRFYDKSHKAFGEFFEPQRDDGRPNSGWTLLTEEQRQSLRLRCPLVKPDCPPGSLVLWDSRTVHSPTEGTDFSDGRFAIYLCYAPLWEKAGNAGVLKAKQDAFTERRATAHWPVPQKLFGKTARQYGTPDDKAKQSLMEVPVQVLGNADGPTDVERLLFGFDEYHGQEGRLLGEQWRMARLRRQPLLKFTSPFDPCFSKRHMPSSQGKSTVSKKVKSGRV